ncbi:hypothetical protein [Paraburkholderia sp. J10-1]|uniref:hypothetical protein n=1 Tax=Paraburkholderia sp. J10-1 TaxID=2805430 RepID=UPI002AB70B4D|nr:hypothetical protein [Paraburkholderia sp. J10-1]
MSGFESFMGSVFGAASVASVLGYLGKQFVERNIKVDLEYVKAELADLAEKKKLDRTEQASVRAVVKRYSRVVMLSAADLQDRLWHFNERIEHVAKRLHAADPFVTRSSKWPMTGRHYLVSTMYCFARYLCWIEILKRNLSVLEFNDDAQTREFNHLVKRVERMLADTGPQNCWTQKVTVDQPVFQFMQMEIGESVLVAGETEIHCMSYRDFRVNYDSLLENNEGLLQLQNLLMTAAKAYVAPPPKPHQANAAGMPEEGPALAQLAAQPTVTASVIPQPGNFCPLRLRLIHNALVDLTKFLNTYNKVQSTEPLVMLELKSFRLDEFDKTWPAFGQKTV